MFKLPKQRKNLTQEESSRLVHNRILVESIKNKDIVIGNFNVDYLLKQDYGQNIKLNGEILLFNNNWFEGIFKTKSKKNYFCFGVFQENYILKLFLISEYLSYPLLSKFKNNSTLGNVELIGISRREKYASCEILVNLKHKINKSLKEKISEWKLNNSLNNDMRLYIKLKTLSDKLLPYDEKENNISTLFNYNIFTLRNNDYNSFFKEIHNSDIASYVSQNSETKTLKR